jgi:hypothetical protein
VYNEIDGPTLVTLRKEELRSELGIVSLPAWRYLWDLIESLRSQQETSDYSVALDLHEAEIDAQGNTDSSPDESGGGHLGDAAVVAQLCIDAVLQRQLVEDHLLSFRLQKQVTVG